MKKVKINEKMLKAGCPRALLSRWHALCWRCLQAGCCHTLQMFMGTIENLACKRGHLNNYGLKFGLFIILQERIIHYTLFVSAIHLKSRIIYPH